MTSKLKRRPSALENKQFDLLVIGGGIIGLATAYDAASRGLSVALVDRADFGGASSQGCFKIVHGGLRYLQHLDFGRLFSSVREQRTLRQIAPHLIQPLPILVPCYGYGMKGLELLRLGTSFYEALAFDRNEGVDPALRLPRHRVLSSEQCLNIAPQLRTQGLRGGVVFFDAQMTSSERLSLAFALSAAKAGAVLCSYVEATGVSVRDESDSGKLIESVALRCLNTKREFSCSARMVVNATGPWAPLLASLIDSRSQIRPERLLTSQGIQLVVPQTIRGFTVAVESSEHSRDSVVGRGARSFFLMPWRGFTLLGTSDSHYLGDPRDFRFQGEAVKKFVREARAAYDHPNLSLERVRYVFGGVRPVDETDFWTGVATGAVDSLTISKRNILVDHAEVPPPGPQVCNLFSVSGIKYTTCRGVAETLVDKVMARLGRSARCRTADMPLVGGEIPNLLAFVSDRIHRWAGLFPEAVVRHLVAHYGTSADEVVALAEQSPALTKRLSAHSDVIEAELVYGARFEMVERLSDVVFRRTGFCTLGRPGDEALNRASLLVSAELGWTEDRRKEELCCVEQELGVGLDNTN